MKLTYAARTDVGMIRSGNEDNFAVDANATRGMFIVADGMGGHAAGEVASEMAVQIVLREIKDVADLADGTAPKVRCGRQIARSTIARSPKSTNRGWARPPPSSY